MKPAGNETAHAASLFSFGSSRTTTVVALLEAASARMYLAKALLETGDTEGAALELDSAETVFQRSGVRLYLEDCRKLREVLHIGQSTG